MAYRAVLPSRASAGHSAGLGGTAYAIAARQQQRPSTSLCSGPPSPHPRSLSSSLARAAPENSSIASVEGLQAWLASRNVQMDKVAVSRRVDDGRPVLVAAKDLAAGEAALTVPDDLWLTPAVAQSRLRDVSALEPWLQLALLLLVERFSPKPSAYVQSLPTVLDSPLFWSEEQLAMLAGTQILQSVAGYASFFEAKYEELQSRLPGLGLSGEGASYPAFLWAAATVRGQMHAPLEGDSAALVPGADLVVHRRAANTSWKTRNAGLFGRGRVLTLDASRAVRRGEELSLDYGAAAAKLDSMVLLDHGVVDKKGLQPGYLLTLEIPGSDRYVDDKQDILEMGGMVLNAGPLAASFNLRPGQAPPADMLAFLRLVQIAGMDAFLLESIFRGEAWRHMFDPVSESNEDAMCRSMAAGAREALAGYPTSIGEDLALLRSGAVEGGSREEMALQIRLGEKEALDGTLAFFEQRQQDLKRLTYYQDRRLIRLGLLDKDGRTTYDSFFSDGIA